MAIAAMITRRGLLGGLLAMPAIVHAGNLMPLRGPLLDMARQDWLIPAGPWRIIYGDEVHTMPGPMVRVSIPLLYSGWLGWWPLCSR